MVCVLKFWLKWGVHPERTWFGRLPFFHLIVLYTNMAHPCCHFLQRFWQLTLFFLLFFLQMKFTVFVVYGNTGEDFKLSCMPHFLSLSHAVKKRIERMWLCALFLSCSCWLGNIRPSVTCEWKKMGQSGVFLWMCWEMKSSTHLGFSVSGGRPQRLRATHALVYCSPAVKREASTSQFSQGRNTLSILNVRHRHCRTKGAQERST